MVNLDAKKARHAKLKGIELESNKRKSSFFQDIFVFIHSKIFKDSNNNPLLNKLLKKVIVCIVLFLIITPFLPAYELTSGYYLGDLEEEIIVNKADDGEYNISNSTMENGFLMKPAINSTEGDRVGFSDVFVYTVEAGDTLSSIAQKFSLKKETIMGENNIWNANKIRTGLQIKILPVDGLSYSIKKGDTIDSIVKNKKVDKEKLIAQNQLTEDEKLDIGRVIILPDIKREVPVYKPIAVSGSNSAPSTAPGFSSAKAAVGRLIRPANGILTQGYHSRHHAIDIGNRARGPIFAAAAGKVIKAAHGWNGGYGNVIIIDHGNGMQTLYGHNEKFYVKVGQYVEQGQTIAWMGNTGRVYGPTGIHTHFEVRINGVKCNPMNFF